MWTLQDDAWYLDTCLSVPFSVFPFSVLPKTGALRNEKPNDESFFNIFESLQIYQKLIWKYLIFWKTRTRNSSLVSPFSSHSHHLNRFCRTKIFLADDEREHSVKSVCIRSYSGPHFPAFGLNTERYGVSLRIQSKCRKMWTRITPNRDAFYTVKKQPK